jgi:hypothetical protein
MRRILLLAGSTAAIAMVPVGLAVADGQTEHASAHKTEAHHRHHDHRSHVRLFTRAASTSTPTTSSSSDEQTVASVTSFTGGVLELTLTDGSTVSGKVTEGTEIECRMAEQQQPGGGDEHHRGGSGRGGPGPSGSSQRDDGDDNDQGDHDPGEDDDNGEHGVDQGQPEMAPCGVSALVPGAKVSEAELRVSSTGAAWEKVELIS